MFGIEIPRKTQFHLLLLIAYVRLMHFSASRMLLRQGPIRPSKVLLENGGLAGEDDSTKGVGLHGNGKKGLSERSPTFVRRPQTDLAPGVRVVVKVTMRI